MTGDELARVIRHDRCWVTIPLPANSVVSRPPANMAEQPLNIIVRLPCGPELLRNNKQAASSTTHKHDEKQAVNVLGPLTLLLKRSQNVCSSFMRRHA